MKKLIVTFCFLSVFTWLSTAQKFATVDMSYILKNIPAYETANEQINQVSKKWQSEVEALQKEAETMYKNYQTELVFMSEDMKKKREEEIVAKEKEAQELKRKYFGPEGELFKKRESLMKPIQDEVYTAIQSISKERNLELVFDKSTAMSVIFTTPGIDISDEVLKQLGYSK
ncbi:MAG TPA: OmpH family outer membrane protein [Paludibacteraceae bacterium]|jgi:outer membrane protein|nr:OmpH family outer membrane protein [Paludibacteraceae bacterium]MDS1031668.1 OmpH family outer membrane protein [Porphyromonadaceae sp. NP-X]NLJ20909.1 OmpH family outer membrane protein [Bacteroidales bacterium]MBP9017165.1 OmpH family outer membrane protein [Paludibacteraceae bacterium]HNZ61575.1 OmpH family outer membrane protein [Paludibacteraceae bacterium]